MTVPVVGVRDVLVLVGQPIVAVPMRERLVRRILYAVLVTVVLVAQVHVLVFHLLVSVQMGVAGTQNAPHAEDNQELTGDASELEAVTEKRHRQHGPDERRGGEQRGVGRGPAGVRHKCRAGC